MRRVPQLLAIAAVLGILAITSAATRGEEKSVKREKHPLHLWSGVIDMNVLNQIPNAVEVKIDDGFFASGVINDAKSLAKFAAAAGKRFPQDNTLVNFDKQMVVVTVLQKHTNAVKPLSFSKPKDGVATFRVQWHLIEPFYRDAFPAACHVVPRKGVKRVEIQLDRSQSLGEIVLKKK